MKLIRKIVLQYYTIFCNLSIDVAIGVLCNQLAIAKVFQLNLPVLWYIGLPIISWIVYLSDHVVDVFRNKGPHLNATHLFIRKNVRKVLWLIVVLSVLSVYLVQQNTDKTLWLCGAVMAVFVLLHFIVSFFNPLRRTLFNNKELGVAFIYATSIYILPLYKALHESYFEVMVHFYLLFLLITYVNLLQNSLISFTVDKLEGQSSFIQSMGYAKGEAISKGVFASAMLYFAWIWFAQIPFSKGLLGCYFLMLAAHAIIWLNREKLRANEWYKRLAELSFWIPVLLWNA